MAKLTGVPTVEIWGDGEQARSSCYLDDCVDGITISKRHVSGPQGVRGRNCDTTRLRTELVWTPRVTLEEGYSRTYAWIESELHRA